MKYEREYNKMKIISEFIKAEDLSKENLILPITQASCICYDDKERILIISDKPGKWNIPGGKPEEGEKVEESAIREVMEEANVEIEKPLLIGAMKIFFKDNPNKREGENFLQARFISRIKKINPQKEDPATNKTFDRKFIDKKEFTKYITWPESEEIISEANKKIRRI